jgi:hypothetical protein
MTWKVYEQSHDNDGLGEILVSYTEATGGRAAAEQRARQMATENSPTRFYVLATVASFYRDKEGTLRGKSYDDAPAQADDLD